MIRTLCILLIVLISSAGCGKRETHSDTNFMNETPTAVVTASIDGSDFQALSSNITVHFDSLLNRYILTANQSGSMLTIEMSEIVVGQFSIDFDHYLISLEQDSVTYNGGNSPQGVIEITSVQSGKFSGTFSATLRNLFSAQEVTVTNGIITTVPF